MQALKRVITPNGQIGVGEPYYLQEEVPQELIEFEGDTHTEVQFLHILNEEDLDLKRIVRASDDDKDWYASFWSQKGQEMYRKHMRNNEGWGQKSNVAAGRGLQLKRVDGRAC